MLEGLGRIKVPKSSDVLAERLKQEILGDGYNLGAALPTERELVSTTGLSRGSVREALRILEAQGLVHTRAGRYGGTTVSQPTADQLAEHINLFAKGRSVTLSALVEVRLALEPMVAALAAERRTENDLSNLRAIAERIDWAADNDLSAFLEENVNWHDAIAAASHNDLLHAFATSVRDEIQAGEIKHALRFTLDVSWKPHLWPARHDAPSGGPKSPPMGTRVRLKSNFDISKFSATNQVVLKALKKYGMFLADNGGGWFVNGAPNPKFNDDDLHLLIQITPRTAFEVVDTSTWMVDPNSAQAMSKPYRTATVHSLDLSRVRAYPNPWRADQPYGRQITFDHLPDSATVRVFTISGRLVKTLTISGGLATWDLRNSAGELVASGLYIYLVTAPDGQKIRRQIALIR